MSQITTHVLDTSLGQPAAGLAIKLQQLDGENWKTLGEGLTNEDGRITDLLPDYETVPPGVYRMYFDTGSYYKKLNQKTFYPFVTIVFETFDTSHYHVPLLLNPFGHSTYRGS
ncbi:MAG: hydroxyisourate hydrolase [Aureispira sp.]|nr:hydroxyisourate hydrolase [Aureispira sp.]